MDRKVFLSFLLIVLFVALYLIAANGSVWLSDCPWGQSAAEKEKALADVGVMIAERYEDLVELVKSHA
jgi:hypothetical protein